MFKLFKKEQSVEPLANVESEAVVESEVVVDDSPIKTESIFVKAKKVSDSEIFELKGKDKTFHLNGFVKSGTGIAEVHIQVSNDGENFAELIRLRLPLSSVDIKNHVHIDNNPWKYLKCRIGKIEGDKARINLIMACYV